MNKLSKIDKKSSINSIIKRAQEERFVAVVWRLVGDTKYTTDVRIRIFNNVQNYLVIKAFNQRSEIMLQDLVSGMVSINIYIPDQMVLFQSDIKEVNENNEIVAYTPKMVALVDRRNRLRLNLYDLPDVNVNFRKAMGGGTKILHTFKKKIRDISASGLSFYTTKMESRFFSPGDKLQNLKMVINGHKIHVDAEVVNNLKVDPNEVNRLNYKATLVGIRFTNINSQYEQILDQFVFKYVDVNFEVG